MRCSNLADGYLSVKSWIDLWLRQRNNRSNVLLALFDPVYQGVSSSIKGYLEEVAKRAGMEFLIRAEETPDYG